MMSVTFRVQRSYEAMKLEEIEIGDSPEHYFLENIIDGFLFFGGC